MPDMASRKPDAYEVNEALWQARRMSSLSVEFAGRVLGLDDEKPIVSLSREEADLLMFAITDTKVRLNKLYEVLKEWSGEA